MAFQGHNTASNALIVNVVHIECDVLASPPNWTNIAADVNTWLGQKWRNILSTADTFDTITVTDENYPGSTHGQGVFVAGGAGARAPNDFKLDPALCVLDSWRTAVAKRYARGHVFYPPAYDTTTVAGVGGWLTSAAYWIACKAFGDAYVAGSVAGSTSYVAEVFSPHLVALGQTPFSTPIKGHLVGSRQHWLRSRSTAP